MGSYKQDYHKCGKSFTVLMGFCKYGSLGQLTDALPLRRDRLFEVVGQYRGNK
jgi:hypothetical protein